MFKEVEAKPDFPKLEEEILKFWKKEKIFQRSLKKNEGRKPFVFYEGPPTANGRPGIHHVLARAFKDLFPRYHTMKGEYCLRKGGWDTHGLPVEIEVEKELGLAGKSQIEEYGIDKFNAKCKESVFRYVKEWEDLTERMGFWIDMTEPYITLKNEYIESCWWILKQFYKKGLLVKDYKVVPYCPRCGTPLSSHEVAQGYEDVSDPSIYVKFKVRGAKNIYFLAWTTTPWTLPGNVALAVDKKADYVSIKSRDTADELILAEKRLTIVGKNYEIKKRFKGSSLIGKEYEPLFSSSPKNENSHKIVAADFVSLEEGTGIVHTAVMYGIDDFNLGTRLGLPKEHTVDDEGKFKPIVKEFSGMLVKAADTKIIQNLEKRGGLYKREEYLHAYPFCWRCHGPLIYYAYETWFIRTTEKKDELLAENNKINWIPVHVKSGRMGNWLQTLVDWTLSRRRYWGTPLNIWQCKNCSHFECLENIKDIAKLGGKVPRDLHRPFIDEVTLNCPKCEGRMKREEEVIDVWFDSGAMPVAQWGYPRVAGSEKKFTNQFPADYISEAMDQTRGWFFTLLAESVLLFGKTPYKNVISLGLVLDEQGKKMSKHLGNVISPWVVIEKTGVDAVRWYFFSSMMAGNEYHFGITAIEEVVRRFFLILWNSYKFFVTYAHLDNWQPAEMDVSGKNLLSDYEKLSVLDRWLLAELNTLIEKVRTYLDDYDVFRATKAIEDFTNDFSTWYIRRSRERVGPFASESLDKQHFYQTSLYALVCLTKLFAPFVPFLSEHIFKDLTGRLSVHLEDFPEPIAVFEKIKLRENMKKIRDLVEKIHAERKEKFIKVRQPLRRVKIRGQGVQSLQSERELMALIRDEVNVKDIELVEERGELKVELDMTITPELKAEGEAREMVRKIQALRKHAGCRLDEKIIVFAPAWPMMFGDYIKQKVLAETLEKGNKLEIRRL